MSKFCFRIFNSHISHMQISVPVTSETCSFKIPKLLLEKSGNDKMWIKSNPLLVVLPDIILSIEKR